jgi:uncharacterized protein YjbI with pentapeptide repeats
MRILKIDGSVFFEGDFDSLKQFLQELVKLGKNLSHADLYHADLSGADLSDADLSEAHLIGTDLRGAKNLRHEN